MSYKGSNAGHLSARKKSYLLCFAQVQEEISLNMQEFYSNLWYEHCLFYSWENLMLYKNIKENKEATNLKFCNLQISVSMQMTDLLLKFWVLLGGKQHLDLIFIWRLSFINGKAVSLCTELRLGLASVFRNCTPKWMMSFIPIPIFWDMSFWYVLLPVACI